MYGKIFDSIYTGTLYGQWEAIVTFQQMIVLSDADGNLDMTPPAIAAVTSIPLEIIQKGLEVLAAPDPYSRTPGAEGRRIELIDGHRPWGWHIINHEKYRSLQDADTVRAQTRERVRKHREEKRAVTDGNAQKRHTDTDTDTDTKTKEKKPRAAFAPPDWVDVDKWNSWVSIRPAKARTHASLEAAVVKLEAFRSSGYNGNEIIVNSLANGWQGLFAPDKSGAQAQSLSAFMDERDKRAAY